MIPTVQQVFDLARFHVGDTAVPGGQTFTNLFLSQAWGGTYAALYRWLDRNSNKRIRRLYFYNLPANTGRITPADMGIQNMGKVENIWDRKIAQTFNPATILFINPPSLGVPSNVQVTVSSTAGLATGQQALAFQFGAQDGTVTDDMNGEFYFTVIDGTTLQLNGCSPADLGGGVGSQGVISIGGEEWNAFPVEQDYKLTYMPLNSNNSQLTQWKWENGAFWFVPSTMPRQLRIECTLSGAAPASPVSSVGIDDSLDALALFLGGAACQSKGFLPKAGSLFMRAIGNDTGDTTHIMGGAFYELVQLGLQELNQTPIILPRYRPRRNIGPFPNLGYVR